MNPEFSFPYIRPVVTIHDAAVLSKDRLQHTINAWNAKNYARHQCLLTLSQQNDDITVSMFHTSNILTPPSEELITHAQIFIWSNLTSN